MSAKMDIIEADDVKNVHVPHSVIFYYNLLYYFICYILENNCIVIWRNVYAC